MVEKVKQYLRDIIQLSKNKEAYLEIIQSGFKLEKEFIELFDKYGYNYEIRENKEIPQVDVILSLGSYINHNFEINYEYHLSFTKLHKVYKDFFRYEIVNRDPENMTGGVLVGDENVPLTLAQYTFYEELTKLLSALAYVELAYRDLTYVICDPEDLPVNIERFIGDQLNADLIFFNNVFVP